MFLKEEELDFTVPASMRELMLEKLNTPSMSNYREKEVTISNLPTYNGRYLWLTSVVGMVKPPSLNKRLAKSRAGVVLQLYATKIVGAGEQEEVLFDRDPMYKEPVEGMCIQMVHFLPRENVTMGKGRCVKSIDTHFGLVNCDENKAVIKEGDSLIIYGNAKLGVRYSSVGHVFRYKGAEGYLWYSMNKGVMVAGGLLDVAVEEMTTGAAALREEELAIV